jgi:predicted metal-dependent phosphoesterase TrpH
MKNFLSGLPSYPLLHKDMKEISFPSYREANCHIHTPYSFSAFSDMTSVFELAKNEKIAVLGINDFFVTDGYDSFHKGCIEMIRIIPEEFISAAKDLTILFNSDGYGKEN